jgi:hypothetical protein
MSSVTTELTRFQSSLNKINDALSHWEKRTEPTQYADEVARETRKEALDCINVYKLRVYVLGKDGLNPYDSDLFSSLRYHYRYGNGRDKYQRVSLDLENQYVLLVRINVNRIVVENRLTQLKSFMAFWSS